MHNILKQKNGSEKNLDEYEGFNNRYTISYEIADSSDYVEDENLPSWIKTDQTVKELATTVNDEPQSIHENYTRYGEQGNRGENFAKPLQENEVRDFDLRGFLLKENRTMVAQKRAKLLKEGREIN